MNWQGKPSVLGAKPVSVPFHPRQIPHALTLDWTRASVVRGQGLTALSVSQRGYWQLLSLCYLLCDVATALCCIVDEWWIENDWEGGDFCLQGLKKNAESQASRGGNLCPDRDAKRAPSEYRVCLETAADDNCVMWLVHVGCLQGARLRRVEEHSSNWRKDFKGLETCDSSVGRKGMEVW
jgi:hypothetical protein